jgi:ABC-type tungstate transport system substrate-binding protein
MANRSDMLVLEIARERQAAVLEQANALDTKAAGLIGFAGVVLGLLFSSDLAADRWNLVFTAGAILLGASIVPFGIALFPRRFGLNPNVGVLVEKYSSRDEVLTARFAAGSIRRAVRTNLR